MFDPQTNQATLPITRRVAGLCYALFTLASSLILWPLFLVGLAFKLHWQKRAKGTWLESHFEWQRNTLVVALAVYAASQALSSGMLDLLPMGDAIRAILRPYAAVIMVVTSVWLAWRMISGWQQLHRYLPMGIQADAALEANNAGAKVSEAALEGNPETTQAEPANPIKSAVRSLNVTALIVVTFINLSVLYEVDLGGVGGDPTGPGGAFVQLMSVIIWLGLAVGGTVVYGTFLSIAWLSADKGHTRTLAISTSLVMILINWFAPDFY